MKFKVKDRELEIRKSIYNSGHYALAVVDAMSGEGVAILTVDTPNFERPKMEFAIKTWGENERIIPDVFNTGMFEDTGRRGTSDEKDVTVELWVMADGRYIGEFPDLPTN